MGDLILRIFDPLAVKGLSLGQSLHAVLVVLFVHQAGDVRLLNKDFFNSGDS